MWIRKFCVDTSNLRSVNNKYNNNFGWIVEFKKKCRLVIRARMYVHYKKSKNCPGMHAHMHIIKSAQICSQTCTKNCTNMHLHMKHGSNYAFIFSWNAMIRGTRHRYLLEYLPRIETHSQYRPSLVENQNGLEISEWSRSVQTQTHLNFSATYDMLKASIV